MLHPNLRQLPCGPSKSAGDLRATNRCEGSDETHAIAGAVVGVYVVHDVDAVVVADVEDAVVIGAVAGECDGRCEAREGEMPALLLL